MKLLNILLFVCVAGMMSCGSDDDCVANDWVGTYTLDETTASCSGTGTELSETVTITLGTQANSLDFDGIEVEVTGCSIEIVEPYFGFTIDAELDGDEISVEGLGCTGVYVRD